MAELTRLRRRVADPLDVVAIGIEHEGAVIVRVILRPQSRCAIVLAAGRERGAVEGVDRGAILGGDRNVKNAPQSAFTADPENVELGGMDGDAETPLCGAASSDAGPLMARSRP